MNAKDEKALATTRARSQTLLQDGYTIHVDPDHPGVYGVQTPIKRAKGQEFRDRYTVDTRRVTCTCGAFHRFGECKHQLAVSRAVAEAQRLLAPMMPISQRAKELDFA